MTYTVSGGSLNATHSLTHQLVVFRSLGVCSSIGQEKVVQRRSVEKLLFFVVLCTLECVCVCKKRKRKIVMAMTLFFVLSLWHSHCDSLSGLSDQC